MAKEPLLHRLVHHLGRGELWSWFQAGLLGQWMRQARHRCQPDVVGLRVPVAQRTDQLRSVST